MPGDSDHPVTLRDLLTIGVDRIRRPATVADLVSALRAEGILVVEKENGGWHEEVLMAFDTAAHKIVDTHHGLDDLQIAFDIFADALAEAQPFPPAGG